jgi:hypothetical protein
VYGRELGNVPGKSFSTFVGVIAAAILTAAWCSPRLVQAVVDEPQAAPGSALQQLPAIPNQELLESLHPDIPPALAVLWQTTESDAVRLAAAQKLRPLINDLTPENSGKFRRPLLRWLDLLEASFAAGAVADLAPQTADFSTPLRNSIAGLRSSVSAAEKPFLDGLPLAALDSEPGSETALKAWLDSIRQLPEQTPEHRAFLLSPAVQQLKSDVEKSLASIATWPDEQATRDARTATLRTLVAEVIRNEIRPSADLSDRIRSQWRFLRTRFPAAADLMWPVVSKNVMNHNVHVNLSETLLGRLVSDFRTESGRVADCILGARVTGTQTTDVRITADVTPSDSTAAFRLKLSGNTRSETAARKDPATVFTSGNHYFWIDKPFEFDGSRVSVGQSQFSVDTNSYTRGFRTKFDGIPLFGMIVRGAAKQQIAESKPKSEAITARKLRDQAQPKFDSESGSQFEKLNADIEKTLAALRTKGAAPDNIHARSSHSHAAISTRSLGIARVGGSIPPEVMLATDTGVLQIHESAANATLDALGLHGRVIPADQLTDELEKSLSQLLQRDIKLSSKPDTSTPPTTNSDEPPTFWVFNGRDPIQVQFGNGQVTIILQAAIRREGQDDIARHSVLIPLSIELRGDKLVITPDQIRIIRTSRTSLAVANQIRNIVQKRVQPSESNAVLNLQPNAPEPLPLTISQLSLEDGWLTLQVK